MTKWNKEIHSYANFSGRGITDAISYTSERFEFSVEPQNGCTDYTALDKLTGETIILSTLKYMRQPEGIVYVKNLTGAKRYLESL